MTTEHTTDQPTAAAATIPTMRVSADPDRVQHLDPRALITDRNVREDGAADNRLISSVRDVGVLQPIIAVVTADGRARVLYGHRRTHAGIVAERATVPVIVRADEGDAAEAEAQRISQQIMENELRSGLTQSEQLGAFSDLAALGKTPGQIAKLTKARRRDVVDGLKAAQSAEVRDAVAAANLTLDQGATLAEFAGDDDAEAYAALLDAATGHGPSWQSFEHLAARLREDRAEKAQRAALLAELTDASVVVITAPSHSDPVTDLDDLTNDPETATDPGDAGGPGDDTGEEPSTVPPPISPAGHADCPGHAAYLRRDYRARTRPAPGIAVYVCTAPLTHGHRARYSHVRLTAAAAPPKRVDETTEQAAAREAAKKDADTAQRRRVLAGNRAWRAAETVRRDYLRTLLARKTPPKGSGPYLATTLTLDAFAITRAAEKGHELAAALLTGHKDIAGRERVAALAEGTSDARGQVIALGLILAGVEASTGVHSWRHADDRHGGDWRGESPALGRYLRFLVATGYPLAPIERFAIGEDVDETDVFTPPGTDPGDLDIADDDEPADPDGTGAEQEAVSNE